MTQKEAVEKLIDWLPKKVFYDVDDIPNMKCMNDAYINGSIFHTSVHRIPLSNLRIYHFSKVSCRTKKFVKTPCTCIKVSSNNHIVWFKEHFPYKGDCR
jgi:hypothetical protein